MQIAQARRIGRRNIDGQIIGAIGKPRRPCLIIGNAVFRLLIGTNIDPDRASQRARLLQTLQGGGLPAIVKTEAVNQRTLLRQTKYARAWIAGLGQGRERAYFGKAETDAMDTGNGRAILIKTGGHAERIGEIEPHNMLRQNRFILRRRAETAQHIETAQGQPMRCFGGRVKSMGRSRR